MGSKGNLLNVKMIIMIIGNPKVRKKMNSAVDNFGFALYLIALPFAIIAGLVAGVFERIFKR